MSATSGRENSIRRALAAAEHLAHHRAGEEHVRLAVVRARLARRHRAADLAVEGVLEHHRLDAERDRVELVEDRLRVVGAVVAADAGVVAPDDEVRAAVVLAADRVPHRLARAAVAHRGGEGREQRAVGRVVVLRAARGSSRRARPAGTSSPFVSPTSGWMRMPSTVSSAHFVTYSCARWIGLRVWKPTTRFQPRSANAARVCSGSSARSGNAGAGRSKTVMSPAR